MESSSSRSWAAGLDEAGRGCLAGPVVACAVILPLGLPGLDDSKKLSPKKREALAPLIKKHALAWSLGIVWPPVIDRINILQASLLAMSQAVRRLRPKPALLLLDGNQVIPGRMFRGEIPKQKAIVGGDALLPEISAASILAKTFRDRLMRRLDQRWPEYGFARHKGYAVKAHYEALATHGPCPMHRLSFRGVVHDESLRLYG